MKKRIVSIITVLSLVMALLPAAVAPVSAADYSVGNSDEFRSALSSAQDGNVIQLTGSFVLENPVSNNDSLVIDKAVTIQGNGQSMTLRYCGILLGADVTFENITLGLTSRVRNAIMANGHTLTLENVKRDSSARYIHLFCGGLSGGTQESTSQGGHGQIIIKGNTDLGQANIYAGSISTDGQPNVFDKPATVTIDPSVTDLSIEHIYASGALETPVQDDWFNPEEIDPPTPSTADFPVSGDVTFNLYGNKVNAVDGDTGTSKYAKVTYNGTNDLNDGLVLTNIASLEVQSGNLVLANGSSFAGTGAPLGVAAGATLGLQNLGSEVVAVGDFTGGGSLGLGQNQKLTVAGAVSGTTTVGIGGIFNGHSQASPDTNGHVYIDAPGSTGDSFALAPPNSLAAFKLVKDGSVWKAEEAENVILVSDFKLGSVVAAEEANVDPDNPSSLPSLPFYECKVTPENEPYPFLGIELTISVNGTETTVIPDGFEDGDEVHSTGALWLYVTGESLEVSGLNYSFPPIGTYVISVTIPVSNSGTGQPITRTATLTVKEASSDPDAKTAIPKPQAQTGLVYTGQEQVGVPVGGAYELVSGDASATDAGSYTATVKPVDGFEWDDDHSTNPVDIDWSIAKADNPNRPTGLAAAVPSADGASDGKITGVTTAMEYSADGTAYQPCTGAEITGLSAGSYYVRIAETKNYKAGEAVTVTIPAGGSAGSDPIAVTGVTLNKSAMTLTVGGSETLTATVAPSDATNQNVSWSSSGAGVATVDSAGKVTAVSAGTATITVTTQDGNKTASCTVTVNSSGGSGSGGGSTGGGSTGGSWGGGSSGGSNTSSTTTRNPDGSTTTTTTNSRTGAVTVTHTDREGNKTQTVTQKDGSSVATVTRKDGTTATVTTSAGGQVEAQVKLSASAVSEAQGRGGTVPLPIPAVKASWNTTSAPAVTLSTGSGRPVKVEIPAAAPTPGTVAVLVKTGGEEVIKTSIPTGNGIVAELPDGATVKIVDRSRSYSDMPAERWAADAISFASARELFFGTGPDTFSPGLPMTRGMLTTVLARFDGVDTSGSPTWYGKGMEWAVANGISDGSDPEGDISREQLAVMLWRYAGSPASYASLDGFSDAGEASGYAREALRWAVENGVMSGYGDGRLGPKEQATRAQVAQMLKKLIERF